MTVSPLLALLACGAPPEASPPTDDTSAHVTDTTEDTSSQEAPSPYAGCYAWYEAYTDWVEQDGAFLPAGDPLITGSYLYDERGRAIEQVRDLFADGDIEEVGTWTYEGDHLIRVTVGDGASVQEMAEFTYAGDLRVETLEYDVAEDGTPTLQAREQYTYDPGGRIQTSVRDDNVDDVTDSYWTYRWSLLEQGWEAHMTYQSPVGGDPEQLRRTAFGFDGLVEVDAIDHDADGVDDRVEYGAYDEHRRLVSHTIDWSADGTIDTDCLYTYVGDTADIATQDCGTPTERSLSTWAYEAPGRPSQIIQGESVDGLPFEMTALHVYTWECPDRRR